MSRKKKKKVIHKPRLDDTDNRYLAILFIIVIAIVPLLLRVKMISFTAPRIIAPLLNSGWQSDIFSYYKMLAVIAIAVITLVLLSYKMMAEGYTIQASYLNVPLLLLAMLVLLSTLTSEYKSISLLGMYNLRDGALSFIAYLVLCFTAANTVFKPWFRWGVTGALLIFTIVNTVTVLGHFLGYEIMQWGLIKTLIIPVDLQNFVQGEMVTTMANPNYSSGFAAALFAYYIAGTQLINSWRQRIVYMLAALAAFVIILASLSSSGFVTVVIISPLIIATAFLSRDKKQTLLAGGITLLLCVGIFTGMNAYNPRVGEETLGIMKQGVETSYEQLPEQIPALARILPARPLTACAATETIPPEDNFELPEPGWAAGSGRAYIWGETWRLIQERPILGYGQGTLPYYIPQNDINKITGLNSYSTLISKPHNMYLGMAYGSGIPAMVVLLVLFMLHFYHSGRRLLRAERNDSLVLPAALFLFFCAFIVQWLFNDTVVDAGAIFWILLGAGVSLNTKQGQLPTS